MKRTRWKNITICIVLILMIVFTMGMVAGPDAEEPYDPNNPIPTTTSTPKPGIPKLYLVCASKNSNIYEDDKTTKLFTVGEGDSLLMLNTKSNSNWTCILIDGYNLAYIKTSSLLKNQNNTVQKKKYIPPKSHGEVSLFSNDKSVYIYSDAKKSEKIGVLRSRVSLPDIDEGLNTQKFNRVKVATFSGIGYVYPGNEIISHLIEDINWFSMYD